MLIKESFKAGQESPDKIKILEACNEVIQIEKQKATQSERDKIFKEIEKIIKQQGRIYRRDFEELKSKIEANEE